MELRFNGAQRFGESESIEVYFGGELIDTVTPTGSETWDTYSYTFTGTGGIDTLEFRELAGESDGSGPFVDNVSLVSASPDAPALELLPDLTSDMLDSPDLPTRPTPLPEAEGVPGVLELGDATDETLPSTADDDTLNGGDPAAALLALSGSRCEELSVDAVGVGELEAWLADRLARPDVAVCCASRMFDSACQSDVVSRDGVHQNHCYSVLGCAAGADGATRFRLRNPWGRKGLARAGEGPVDAAGGCFWLGAAPLVNGFSTMYAATLTTPPPTGTSLRCSAATSPDGPAPMTHTERAGRWAALGRGASAAARE